MSELVAKYLGKLKEMMSGKSRRRSLMGEGRSLADLELRIHRDFINRRRPVAVQRWQTRSGNPMSRMVMNEPVPYRKISAFPTA